MNEIEEQFFKAFEIKPLQIMFDVGASIPASIFEYPQITDRILLELICILSEWRTYLHSSYTIKANNTLNLKQDVLKDFLELFKWYEFKKCEKSLKQQVQALFKENN